MPTEKHEERKYVAWVNKMGGRCIKLTTAGPFGSRGDPDRLTLLGPPPVASFKEFKKLGGKVTPLQARVHQHYKRMGIPVHVVYSAAEAIAIDQAALGIIVCKRNQTKAAPKGKRQVRVTTPSSRIFPRARFGENTHRTEDVSDTKATRHRRSHVGDSVKKNNLRRLAAGG